MRRLSPAPALAPLVVASAAVAAPLRSGGNVWCATSRNGARDAVWAHREHSGRPGRPVRSFSSRSTDVGHIAVLRDEGDLALVSNRMDLQRAALRFTVTKDGYSVSRVDLPLEPDTAARLELTDDDSERVRLGFAFPFYGASYAEVFVNSDGNVTFGEK